MCSSVPYTQAQWDHFQQGLEIGQELHPSCVAAEDWQTESCSTPEDAVFSDPLLESMTWLYDMIHIEPVWQEGLLGKGIHVRVNDVGGVEGEHAEFDDRFDVQNSCANYSPPTDGTVLPSVAQHGTGVASMVLGGANNEQCAVGIAPEATLSACTLPSVANPSIYAEILQFKLEAMDISVNSWSLDSCVQKEQIARERRKGRQLQGETCPFSNELSNSPCIACGTSLSTMTDVAQLSDECRFSIAEYCIARFEVDPEACAEFFSVFAECDYDSTMTQEELQSLERGVLEGRQGKGVVFVMSAGNNHVYGDSTNGQKWINTRFTISVGAVDKNGKHASYSATGSSLLVTAPGGDLDHLTNNIVARNGGGCHDISAGTSFSSPVVAGVVGLMLEANPNLHWRDVQGILASTSVQVDPEDDSWVTNAAGFHHSYKYGFGLVHAQAAVEAAKSWDSWPQELLVVKQSPRINLLVPEGEEDPGSTSLVVDTGVDNFETESVVVLLSLEHPSRGDLSITLTSPEGTESILHFSPRPENKHLDRSSYWEMMTVRNWGENPNGGWTLSLKDTKAGNLADECVDIPWSYILDATPEVPTGAKVTCSSVERSGTCFGGQATNPDIGLLQDINLLSPLQACCACGGGVAPTEQTKLDSWTLAVFGRAKEAEVEDSTTDNPPSSGSDTAEQPENGNGDNSDGKSGAAQSATGLLWALVVCVVVFAIECP